MTDPTNDVGQQGSTWPVAWYLLAWTWAIVTLIPLWTVRDGPAWVRMRIGSQLIILSVFAGRLLVAHARKERNRGWMPYVIVMILALPLWLLVEDPFFKLCRSLAAFLRHCGMAG